MATNIFVNLPVKDLEKSKEFFSKLGYTFNQQFTDEKAASLVISENIYASFSQSLSSKHLFLTKKLPIQVKQKKY